MSNLLFDPLITAEVKRRAEALMSEGGEGKVVLELHFKDGRPAGHQTSIVFTKKRVRP